MSSSVPFVPLPMLGSCLNELSGMNGTAYEFLLGEKDMKLCGLFDGCGPKGRLVSEKVRGALPVKLLSEWRSLLSREGHSTPNEISNEALDQAEKVPEIFTPLQQALIRSFQSVDNDLKRSDSNLDSFCSGATALTLIKMGSDLLIANLGKSRAVLGTKDAHNNLIFKQLTVDLKPNLAEELDRILSCGGRVFPTEDDPKICRFFQPRCDEPGLPVSRAFGNFCLKKHGLISVPHFSHHRLTPSDKFVIMATQGVWDVLSNEQAVEIVESALCRESAAQMLVDRATHLLSLKNPSGEVDLHVSAIVSYVNEDADIFFYERVSPLHHELLQKSHEFKLRDGVYQKVDKIEVDQNIDQAKIDDEIVEKEQEGTKKNKRGEFHIRMPKFLKKPWGQTLKRLLKMVKT